MGPPVAPVHWDRTGARSLECAGRRLGNRIAPAVRWPEMLRGRYSDMPPFRKFSGVLLLTEKSNDEATDAAQHRSVYERCLVS
jgi:hypothetical protein